jgi:hypothetical protein
MRRMMKVMRLVDVLSNTQPTSTEAHDSTTTRTEKNQKEPKANKSQNKGIKIPRLFSLGNASPPFPSNPKSAAN